MRIGNIEISKDVPPALIVEMSGNHNQSLDRALQLVKIAADTGAKLLKLQTYTPDTITLNCDKGEFRITSDESLWAGRTLYSLYEEAQMPWHWQSDIIKLSRELGLDCFSSVFDSSSVQFLEDLGVSAYKIASQEVVHLPLIKEVARTGKPLIISTGMASLSEISDAVEAVSAVSSSEVCLLKCTSSYPASPAYSNVTTIPMLRKIFGCEVGLSDHTLGIGAALSAIAHGATVVEKHLTVDRSDGGVDSAFSLEPDEFKLLVKESLSAWEALGTPTFGPTKQELISMSGRRSIYASCDIKSGEALSANNIRVVRPSGGLKPAYYEVILGRLAKENISFGTPISWDLIA